MPFSASGSFIMGHLIFLNGKIIMSSKQFFFCCNSSKIFFANFPYILSVLICIKLIQFKEISKSMIIYSKQYFN